ncbi:MAG: ChrB protein [Candidatus Entotheonella factor]|uniref:ChrB protein n=1 Tax=Entotheonella factor TaxID=1429438 RepID=W4LK08_ENTF1|nr:MAG: ChrB protein [Candidatus Entotheonella factor]
MAENPHWLLLIHQLPPKPDYFRVKIRRRLHRIGAVALKSTVYLLPHTEQAMEDFQWVLREIAEGGGDASICEATFVGGLNRDQIVTLFHTARNADYQQLVEETQTLMEVYPVPDHEPMKEEQRMQLLHDVRRLKRRFDDTAALDFFNASGREAAEDLLAKLEARTQAHQPPEIGPTPLSLSTLQGRVWVTRKGIHIDRMASAWLIRRFIDTEATFRFVSPRTYQHQAAELRFDMFDAEFTHEGEHCTFEVLLERTGLHDPALRAIAEIVHDIDVKDDKFQREEAVGIDRLIAGLAMTHKADEDRLARGAAIFDDLYAYFQRKQR